MFDFLKATAQKIFSKLGQKISGLFSRKNALDESFFEELKTILLASDTGPKTTQFIIDLFKKTVASQKISSLDDAKEVLEKILTSLLIVPHKDALLPQIVLLVGINGSGKTTFASKFAWYLKQQGKSVLLVAADTFRAAAVEQLKTWGEKTGIEVFSKQSEDPAAVIFDAAKKALATPYDHLIIDTAGRLQTKVNLMKELEKIRKVIAKAFPDSSIATWLTVDAMIGQNTLEQVRLFQQTTPLSGLIVTKLDGSAKGGIVFSLAQEFKLPIIYLTHGEALDDLSLFAPEKYVKNILENDPL